MEIDITRVQEGGLKQRFSRTNHATIGKGYQKSAKSQNESILWDMFGSKSWIDGHLFGDKERSSVIARPFPAPFPFLQSGFESLAPFGKEV